MVERRSMPRLALAVGVAALLSGCGRGGAGEGSAETSATAAPSMVVTAAMASTARLRKDITASGTVAAWEEMSLGVEITGARVARVLVEPGTQVRAGQALLELDARTLVVQARQADANLAQARARLELARANATRGEQLLAQNLISASNFEELKAARAQAEAQVAVAQADRDGAQLRLGFATLRAPDAGIVSARLVQPGQIVNNGQELLRLIRRGRLEWRAQITDQDLVRVKPGARVQLTAGDGTLVDGVVRAVSPSIDPQTRTALVYADLPEPGPLRAGMFSEGRIVVGETEVSVLPREAVVYRDGLPYVFVLKDGSKVEQRRVDVGVQQDARIELRGGLRPGERVAVKGAGFLSDGDVVRVVNDA